jgi:hypothetical protein
MGYWVTHRKANEELIIWATALVLATFAGLGILVVFAYHAAIPH